MTNIGRNASEVRGYYTNYPEKAHQLYGALLNLTGDQVSAIIKNENFPLHDVFDLSVLFCLGRICAAAKVELQGTTLLNPDEEPGKTIFKNFNVCTGVNAR